VLTNMSGTYNNAPVEVTHYTTREGLATMRISDRRRSRGSCQPE
jgi:hypothetical protein